MRRPRKPPPDRDIDRDRTRARDREDDNQFSQDDDDRAGRSWHGMNSEPDEPVDDDRFDKRRS
jgi:hypothetical protein